MDEHVENIRKVSLKMGEIMVRAHTQGRALSADEAALVAEFRALTDDELRQLPMNAPLTKPGPGGQYRDTEHPAGSLLFETRDGRTVAAVPVNRRFADLEPKGVEWNGIGPGSLGRIIRAKIMGDATGLNDAEHRAMGEGTGIGGGYFVPSIVSSYVIDLARNAAVCMQAGAWTLPMDGPEMVLVKILSDPVAYFVGEHAAITESDGSFGPITLKAIVLGSLVRVSAALLEDAPTAGRAIENMLAASLGLKLDHAILLGNGTNEPRGLQHCAGINTYSMGANGAAPANYDFASYAVQYCFEDNGTPTAIIMAPRTAGELDRLKEATTNASLAPPPSFQALKKFQTNQLGIAETKGSATTASSAFVGDFTNVVVGMRKQLTIDVSPTGASDSFAKVEAMVRAYMRVDVAILRENHFTWISGLL